MTAQVPDRIVLHGRELSIQGVRGEGLFDPRSRGWRVTMMSTACWRGFIATYGVHEGRLVLKQLQVCFAPEGLAVKEPFFAVEVSGPDGDVQRHEVFAREVTIGAGPDVTIRLQGAAVRPHVLRAWGNRFWLHTAGVKGQGKWIADGAREALGGYAVRPIRLGGGDAIPSAEPPELEGHRGRWVTRGFGANTVKYTGMAVPVAYTGGLLACDGFLQDLYVHMGFHPAWKFEHVTELIFEAGVLVHEEDVSAKLAQVREVMTRAPLEPGAKADRSEIEAFVERTFKLDY